jgi:hypothetical protein
VVEITSRRTATEGTFEAPASYGDSEPTANFETEIPAFADPDPLSRLLQRAGVVENARTVPLASRASSR